MVTFRETADRIEGDSFGARIARMSAKAAAGKFEPSEPVPFIRVDFLSGLPDAWALGQTIEQVHSATAQVAKWMRNHASAPEIARVDRDRVPLRPRAAGNSVFFEFPSTAPTPDMLIQGRTETLAEVAAFALIERLPQEAGDDATLDSLLSEPSAIKRAINRLARAANASDGLGISIATRDNRGEHAVLTRDQARVLEENLNLQTISTESHQFTGYLDGMRTKRRLFYFVTASGAEIFGAVPDELLPEVRAHIGDNVSATIETTTVTTPKGKPRESHRMLRIDAVRRL